MGAKESFLETDLIIETGTVAKEDARGREEKSLLMAQMLKYPMEPRVW